MGASSALNILFGLARMKAAALLLGPMGVGLQGLYLNLMQTASTVSSLGIGATAARRVSLAQVEENAETLGRVSTALLWVTVFLALAGAAAFWVGSGLIADFLKVAPQYAWEIAWLSIGVALSVAAVSQSAFLTGLRRIGELARLQIASGLIGTLMGILSIMVWGRDGLLALVLVAPVVTFAVGHFYVRRFAPPLSKTHSLRELAVEWKMFATLGMSFMLGGLATTLGVLVVRSIVQREIGEDALGYFQAAWMIGMVYPSFVLGAMATDYYPRLCAAIRDHRTSCQIINEQTEVALLLCGPVFLAMLAFAPWVIRLLYSAEFVPAAEVLRWQILGDILKVMSWPLAFVMLAAGAGRTFVFTETLGVAVFIGGVMLGLPLMGLVATGKAFLAMYLVYLPLVWWIARVRIGFRWTLPVVQLTVALMLSGSLLVGLTYVSETATVFAGLFLSVSFGAYGLRWLAKMEEPNENLVRLRAICRRVLSVFGPKT